MSVTQNDEGVKKVTPFNRKWFIGNRIQRNLIIYIIGMSLLSQLLAVSSSESYAPYLGYFTFVIHGVFFAYSLYGLWLSNRISGPLARLQRHIDAVAEGETDAKLQFRKSDYGSELAESFNRLVEKRLN